jgi:hypothetical protein
VGGGQIQINNRKFVSVPETTTTTTTTTKAPTTTTTTTTTKAPTTTTTTTTEDPNAIYPITGNHPPIGMWDPYNSSISGLTY